MSRKAMRTCGHLILFLVSLIWTHLVYGHELPLDDEVNCTFYTEIVPSLPQWSVMCPGDLLTLTATQFGGTAPFSYIWSNGETTESITMTIPPFGSDFTVTITDANGCTGTDFIHLKYFEWTVNMTMELGVFCTGQTALLYAALFPYSQTSVYEWSTGDNTAFITISANGTYSCTITDPNMPCPFVVGSIDVTSFVNAPAPIPEISGTTALCPGENGTLYASGGPFTSYVWFPTYGSDNEVLDINGPGTYILFVQNDEGCQGIDTFVVEEGAPQVILNDPDPICDGQSTIVEVVNANNFATFFWSTGENTPSITVTSPGYYSVTVYSPGGCTSLAEVLVEASGTQIDLSAITQPVTSCTNPNGSIDLSASPSGNYSFDWSNGETTEDLTDLDSGTYSVTVTDNGGCSSTGTYMVDNSTSSPASTATTTPSSCDLANGSINQTVSPPGVYTFIWSNGQTTEDLTNVLSGTYLVTVTSVATGCSTIESYTITNNNPPINVSGNTTPVTSCTAPNGMIDLNVTPGGTYTFLWSSGQSTEDIQNLAAGNFSVTVSAGGSCISTASFTIANATSAPTLTFITTPALCGQSNGHIDLTASPGGAYTYNWSNSASSEDLSDIPGGNYQVTVTSADGCTSTGNAVVADNQVMAVITGISTPNTSCATPNGSLDITVNPAASYLYTWSNGATTEDLLNLSAGSYSVTTTLGVSCISTETFIVTTNTTTIDFAAVTSPNQSCSLPDGSIDLTVNTPGMYTYIWSNGETTQDLQQLTGGTYSVTITNTDGCMASGTYQIINSASNFSITAIVTPNYSCGVPDGTINILVEPSGLYVYTWTDGSTSEDIDSLAAGNYGLTVTDQNNCMVLGTFTIQDSLDFPQISSQILPATCGNSNGAIDISIQPPAGNTYLWSNGSTNEDQINLAPADYSVTVTSPKGCVTTDTMTIPSLNSNLTLSATTAPSHSCLAPDGMIDLTVTPAGTYSFLWSNGSITEDLQSLAAGSYQVVVTDMLGCVSTGQYNITSTIAIPMITAVITPSNCGDQDGAIDITLNPIGLYTYLWSDGHTTEDLLNVGSGTYDVLATDMNGCQARDTFFIPNQNSNFSITANVLPNTSCISSNGSIDLMIMPAATYSFIWSEGSMVEDINLLSSGTYSVTVTDASLCSSTANFIVADDLPSISVSEVISPSTCGLANGSISLSVVPANGNSFIWNDGFTSEDRNNLAQGSYTVTITGAGGCSVIDTFGVPASGVIPVLSGTTAANRNCTAPNGMIDLLVSPAGIYTYLWAGGITSEDLFNLSAGNYTVTVTDLTGCSSSTLFTIVDQITFPVITEIILPSTCGGANGSIDISLTPIEPYQYAWSNGSISEDLVNISAGMYAVTVTGNNGCTSTASYVVTNTVSNFTVQAVITSNTSCTAFNGGVDLTISPVGTYTVLWSNGSSTEDLTNVEPGMYTVTVTDLSNCSTSSTYSIIDNSGAVSVEANIQQSVCGESNGRIDLNVTPSPGNIFIWSTGSTTEDLMNVPAGIYSVTITAQNGCSKVTSFDVPGDAPLEINLILEIVQGGNDLITLTAEVNVPANSLDTVLWQPAHLFNCFQPICLEQTIERPSQQTEIIVIAIDTNGCMVEARLSLQEQISPVVYIPNVFSPNGDNINDAFTVYGNKDVDLIVEMQIFDRWGNQVFVNREFPPNQEDYGWDGTFKSKEMNPAVYAYWARVRYKDGTEGAFKGDITLVK